MAIVNGSLTLQGKSTLVSSGKSIFGASVSITGKSNVIIFWLKLAGVSKLTVNPITARLNSVAMNAVTSLKADLVKAGKAFFRQFSIVGDVIYTVTLEGGGGEYMKLNQDFNMVAGDYFELTVKISDESGNPKDISASNFTWVMDSVAKTIGNGIQITDATNGEILITLSPEDTAKLYGTYQHQARMTDAQNHPTTIFKGIARIDKGIA